MPGWRIRAAARSGPETRIRGVASTTPDRELRWMGGPGPRAYRGRHDHLRPASRRADPAVPPRPVVAARLEPGPVPGRGHPGAACPATPRGLGLVGQAQGGVVACPPGSRISRGTAAHGDPATPAAGHCRGGDTAAAGHTGPAQRAGDRRRGPHAGHLAPARLSSAGRPGAGGGRHHRLGDVAGGRTLRLGIRLRLDAACGEPAPARPVVAATRAPSALLLLPDGRLPDRRRDRAAGGRAVAHRRGRGA